MRLLPALAILVLAAGPLAAATLTLENGSPGQGGLGTLPDGVFCGEGCASRTRVLADGASYLVAARPDPGYDFDHWEGDCAGTAPICPVTLDAGRRVRAVFRWHGFKSCGTTATFWDRTPVDFAQLRSVVPLGNLNPRSGHVLPTRHVYLYASAVANVYSPGAAVLVGARYTKDPGAVADYELEISPGCEEVRLHLLHLQSPPPELQAAMGPPAWCDADGSLCTWGALDVPLASGQPLGVIGLTGSPNLDLETYDMRTPALPYANPLRYLTMQLHTACPLDGFNNTIDPDPNRSWVASNLNSRVGSYDGSIHGAVPPPCGSVEQDVPGTAQGNWFLATLPWDAGYFEDHDLALVHDNLPPGDPRISLGDALEGTAPGGPSLPAGNRLSRGLYTFTVYPFADRVNHDFNTYDPSRRWVYCLEKPRDVDAGTSLDNVTILIQMLDANTLLMKKLPYAGCETARLNGDWKTYDFPPVLAGAARFTR